MAASGFFSPPERQDRPNNLGMTDMRKADLKEAIKSAMGDNPSPDSMAEAMILAATTPIDPEVAAQPGAVTAEGSRDETADSIDPATGTLTEDAVAKRAAKRAVDQAADDVAAAEEAVAQAKVDKDKEALAEAQGELDAAKERKAAADAVLAGDDAADAAAGGGAMITVDPNDPATQDGSDNVPITTGAVTTSKDLGG